MALIAGLIKAISKKSKGSEQGTNSNVSIKGNSNIVGTGKVEGNSIQGDYIAKQNVIVFNDHKEIKKTKFSERFEAFQELLNASRVYKEKEYTTEYISSLLGLRNVSELTRFLNSDEEPDDSFKMKFVDVFGVNEEWIMFNRGEYPFASNQEFLGDDPMDILRYDSQKNVDCYIMLIGELERKKHAIIVKKHSKVNYEIIPKKFIFYPEVGAHGESMLVSLYRFVREAERINKLYPIVFIANEIESMNLLKGAVPAMVALSFPVAKNFEEIFLDLNSEGYDTDNLDMDFIRIKEIIRKQISEIDAVNQESDRKRINNNLGKDESTKNDIDEFDNSTSFFAHRFAKAFPGIRGMKVFEDPEEAIDHLEVLLKYPLFSSKLSSPIWWFRGNSNLHISKFSRVSADKILMNSDEIRISRIIAYSATSYYKSFVYVETKPEEPTGLYGNLSEDKLNERVNEKKIYTEEYAVVGDTKITRAEYDDGGMVVDGKPVDVSGKAELRVRYLTPYNFLICAQFNPINDNSYDLIIEEIMDNLIYNDEDFCVLCDLIEKMPKHESEI